MRAFKFTIYVQPEAENEIGYTLESSHHTATGKADVLRFIKRMYPTATNIKIKRI